MTTLNELLAQIEGTQTKTASADPQTLSQEDLNLTGDSLGFKPETDNDSVMKTASHEHGGQRMEYGLHTIYNDHFSEDDTSEKIASEFEETEEMSKEAAQLEEKGELTGDYFNFYMNDVLDKVAADGSVPDSDATQERNQTTGAIPGAAVAQPQLEVNRPADASEAIDTTPTEQDLMDAAVKKEVILRKLEEGKPGEISHKTVSTDMGLEMPTDQADA